MLGMSHTYLSANGYDNVDTVPVDVDIVSSTSIPKLSKPSSSVAADDDAASMLAL